MNPFVLLFALTTAVAAPNDPSPPIRYVLDADTGITIREGFDAEMIYEVPKEQGSWVAMAFDPRGRLIVTTSPGAAAKAQAQARPPSCSTKSMSISTGSAR